MILTNNFLLLRGQTILSATNLNNESGIVLQGFTLCAKTNDYSSRIEVPKIVSFAIYNGDTPARLWDSVEHHGNITTKIGGRKNCLAA